MSQCEACKSEIATLKQKIKELEKMIESQPDCSVCNGDPYSSLGSIIFGD